jgi:vitamin B12/bleomycin/antimicrobial peptide transport system ATP-binding/permease protein
MNQATTQNSPYYTTWQLIKAYWKSPQRLSAYIFLLAIILFTVSMIGIDVIFNYWYNHFYNALQAYDKSQVITLLKIFFAIAGVAIILGVYRYYVSQVFSLRWRKFLTEQFVNRWLANRGYYYLETFDKHTDNPDQRLQEDIAALSTSTIDLFTGLMSAVITFFAFVYILWRLSGVLTINLGHYTLHIHGYLVIVAIFYNIIGTYLTFKIGKPLVNLNFEQQQREASFRFGAVDLRSHSEHVALYNGEQHQKNILNGLFTKVLDNFYAIIIRQKKILWFTAGFGQTAVILPLLVVLPNYFGKVFMLGGLMQSLSAFKVVQESLSYLTNAYTQIAQWRAVTARLTSFANHLQQMADKVSNGNELTTCYESANKIMTRDMSIYTPSETSLLLHINEVLVHGKYYLIKGVSGIGKSTFIRTIAGIWPFSQGTLVLPNGKNIMFLPQKPYMPLGTLADALLFPDKNPELTENDMVDVLQICRLGKLAHRLHETATWSEQLSPGELQRIAFARVLLQKPDWVFLDESTSMLDLANEKHLYEMLKQYLPHCTIVSIGHRPSLDEFHDTIIDLGVYAPIYPTKAENQAINIV